ncbi:signal recognition particle-docking protein FtsY [Thermithiobacillus plumbiphilus]|uniref:Signal recognition particle receptor FtsY n=1 Tax=Thermithiobacillus plumbiphilus TaxID=1729899 RepID=A0ABU9D8C8_9PROT
MFDFFKRNKGKEAEPETGNESPAGDHDAIRQAPSDSAATKEKTFFDMFRLRKPAEEIPPQPQDDPVSPLEDRDFQQPVEAPEMPEMPESGPESTPVEQAAAPLADEAPASAPQEPDKGVFNFFRRDKAPEASAEESGAEAAERQGFFARMKAGLTRTRESFVNGLDRLTLGKKQIDDELLEDLEALLLSADIGLEATTEILDKVTERVRRKDLTDPQALTQAIRDSLLDILRPRAQPWQPSRNAGTRVLMMVGINGAGKTTTIGKLAALWQAQDIKVVLAAGDTFRAAAVEQLQQWGQRVGVPVIAQHSGADSASVIYDGFAAARSRNADLLIADTAGRLHTQTNLMEELKKVKRVLGKLDPEAPQEIWLVIDASTGQNALNQAKQFHEAVGLTGICVTKLDGTAKGGVIAAVAKTLPIPIRYIGVGERPEDLRPFDAEAFVDALFSPPATK